MSKSSWSDIANDPEFKNLSPDDQAEIKKQYAKTLFDDPEFKALSPEDQRAVMSEFVKIPDFSGMVDGIIREHGDTPPAAVNPMDTFQGPPSMDAQRPDIQNLGDLLGAVKDNLGPSLVSQGVKVAGAFADPLGTANGALDLVGGLAAKVLPQDWRNTNNPEGQRMNTAADAAIQDYQQAYGSPQNALNTLGYDPSRVMMDAATIGAPAAGGLRAGLNAMRVPGAAIDAAAMFVNPARAMEGPAQAVGRGARGFANVFDPQGKLLHRATEGLEGDIIAQLRGGTEIVDGSVPTAAEAVANLPNTPNNFQLLGKEAKRYNRTAATAIEEAQNKARLAKVREVGQTPADLEAAIAARDAAKRANYAAADSVMSTADQPLLDLFDRPSMDKVFDRAKNIAAERGVPFQIGTSAPATTTTTASPIMGPHGVPVTTTTTTPATFAQYPGSSLHIVKQAFDDMIKDPSTFGISATEARALMGTRNEFLRWFEDKNPAYAHARQEHARLSRPIDQMKIGQYLEDKLKNPTLGDETMAQRADSFSAALKEAVIKNTNIKRATGEQRYRNLDEILDPHHMSALHAIQDDLARAKKSDALASKPNEFAGELGNAAEAHQAPSFLKTGVTILNALIRTATGHVNEKVAGRVANAMLTPDGAAKILEEAVARKRALDNASRVFKYPGEVIQGVNRVPAVYNALSAERDERNKRNSLAP